MGSTPDRRRLKTRQAIHEALFSLMLEKPYSKITVQDIIDEADVGRSTFYAHYETKEELLTDTLSHLMNGLNSCIIQEAQQRGDTTRLIPVAELFEHIKDNSKLMQGLIRSNSAELFMDYAQSYWDDKLRKYLLPRIPSDQALRVPMDILIHHMTSTLIALLKWWVQNKMTIEPAQMDLYYQQLINPLL